MILNERQLKEINGGTSITLINAIVRGISLLIDFGRSVGSAVRYITSNKTCKVK
ncbi:MAG: hypothetical protein PUA73_02325 [Bacilli bacterium]|nr:hypothetical protein [Bacilli bacterium]